MDCIRQMKFNKEAVPLRPAMELIAHVTYVKWIEKGTEVSYGGTFVAPKRMQIATIPTGYGDGYPRSLSNKGYVLIHGQKAPILGRVCMESVYGRCDRNSGCEIW